MGPLVAVCGLSCPGMWNISFPIGIELMSLALEDGPPGKTHNCVPLLTTGTNIGNWFREVNQKGMLLLCRKEFELGHG